MIMGIYGIHSPQPNSQRLSVYVCEYNIYNIQAHVPVYRVYLSNSITNTLVHSPRFLLSGTRILLL